MQVSGTVWAAARIGGVAGLSEPPAHGVVTHARLEFLSLPDAQGPLLLLAAGETDAAGHYTNILKGVPSQSTVLVVAYVNSQSIGEVLLPIATYLGLAAQDGTILITGDINSATSVVSSLLIAHGIPLSAVTDKQIVALTKAVIAAVLELGANAAALSPADLARALGAQKAFMATMAAIMGGPLPPRDAASVLTMDFATPRQPAGDVLPASQPLVNAVTAALNSAASPLVLSPALLVGPNLVLSGSGVLAPANAVTVQVAQAASPDGGSPSCLDALATSLSSPCPQLVAVTLSAAGAWALTVPETLLQSGRTYTVTVNAVVDPAHPTIAVARRVLTFAWVDAHPLATLVSGMPADPSSTANVNAVVGGNGVDAYSYALLAGAPSCSGATYSSWTPVATPLALSAGADGAKLLCLLGRDAGLNLQALPTAIAWAQHLPGGVVVDATPPVPGGSGIIASSGATSSGLTLSWTAGTDDVSLPAALSYSVYQSPTGNIATAAAAKANGTLIKAGSALTAFTVVGLAPLTTYDFTVLLKDEAGNEAAYTMLAATTGGDVTPPTAGNSGTLTPSAIGDAGLTLSWTAATDNVTAPANLLYSVYQSPTNNMGTVANTKLNGTLIRPYAANLVTFGVTGLAPSVTYYFNVLVKDQAGNETAYGALAASTIADGVPPLAGNSGTITTAGITDQGLTLNWTTGTDDLTSSANLVYSVYQSAINNMGTAATTKLNGTLIKPYTANLATFGVTGLAPSVTYYFNVLVKDQAGNETAYGALAASTIADAVPPLAGGAGSITYGVVTSSSLTLNWTAGTDDVTTPANLVYSVYQSGTNNIGTVAGARTSGTLIKPYTANITSFTATGLAVGTTYYFNVLVKDQAGNETAYTSLSAATVPGAFSISGPPNPGNLGMPDVVWGAAAGATTYTLLVGSVSGCGTPLQTYNSVAGTTQTLSVLADGTYYTCVTAQNAHGDTTTATNTNRSFVINTVPPGAFTITGPASPTVVTAPSVTWGAATGATKYDLRIATALGCAVPTQSYLGVTSTSMTLNNLGAGTYYICVTAKDDATNATPATNSNYVLIITSTLGAFSITGPATPTDDTTPTVTWGTSSAATSYDVVISTANDCAVVTQSYPGVVGTSQLLTALPDGTYYACVTAKSSGPSQAAANTFYQFKVPPIVCDTGNLRTTCVINTLHWVADGKTIAGPGALDVQSGGTIRTGNPTLYYDNFSGGLSANWSIFSGSWSVAGGVLSQTSTATSPDSGNKRIFLNDKAYPDDYTIVAKVRNDTWVNGAVSRSGVDVHVDPIGGAGNSLLYTNNGVGSVKWLDDTAWHGSNAFTMTTGTWYWFKLDVAGSLSTMQGKVWQDGSVEPAYFPAETTMPGRNHGNPGLFGGCAGGGTSTVSFTEVTVSTTKAWGRIAIQMIGNVTVESGGAIEGSLSTLSASALAINAGGSITAGMSASTPGTTGEISNLTVTNLIDVGGTLWANLPNVTAGTFQIDAGGIVKADGKGFKGRFYDAGLGTGAGSWVNAGAGGGGGHGGAGGGGDAAGGATNDSTAAPVLWGSSGGGANGASGGDGGGRIKITTAGGTITVNGTLMADGSAGAAGTRYNTAGGSANGAGGGGGGAIWLSGATLTGSGALYARGGAGGACYSNTSAGGGGGGGMLKKSVTTNTFAGTIAVTGGGTGDCPAGAAGLAGAGGTNL